MSDAPAIRVPPRALSSWRARWDALFDVPGSVRALALLRIALGPAVILHLQPFLRDAEHGVSYRDHFNEPFFSWLPRAPEAVYFPLLWLGVVAAVCMTVGLWTRIASTLTFAVVAYNLLLSQLHYHHNRAYLTILLGGVALANSSRVLSIDAWWRPPPDDRDTIWPLHLLRFEAACVYLGSGISKLLDPDWVGGRVLYLRSVRGQQHTHGTLPGVLGDWVADVATWRPFFSVVTPLIVATEIFIGLGLWHRRTRLAAIWLAILFHLSIELSASVEVFSYVAVAALVIWITPSTRDRTLVTSSPWLARLDWFARFDTRVEPGVPTRVEDRDGAVYEGRDATWFALSGMPLTFPVAAVVRGLGVREPRRRRASRRP